MNEINEMLQYNKMVDKLYLLKEKINVKLIEKKNRKHIWEQRKQEYWEELQPSNDQVRNHNLANLISKCDYQIAECEEWIEFLSHQESAYTADKVPATHSTDPGRNDSNESSCLPGKTQSREEGITSPNPNQSKNSGDIKW